MSFVHVWRPGPGPRTLVLLHGTGGDEHDLLPLATMLDPNASVLSPRGQVLEGGAPRFFRRLAPGVLDIEDLHARTLELAAWLREQAREKRFDIKKTTAVGFSNGANIAAAMLFETPDALGDAILVRAMLPYEPKAPPRVAGKRVLILAGERDPYSRREVTEALARILRQGGADVAVHYAPAGHELTPLDVEVAKEWLA